MQGTSGKNHDDGTSYDVRSRVADVCEEATGRVIPGRFPESSGRRRTREIKEEPWPGCHYWLFW